MNQLTEFPRMAENRLIAQQVTVTATLVDSSGASWNGATVIVQFVPGFGTPITSYTWNGVSFAKRQELQTTGNTLSILLPSNDTILPIDSMWSFTISRNPTTPAVVLTMFLDSKNGPTQDISAQFTVATGGVTPNPTPGAQIIQVPDEATALSESLANPNNFYFWV